MSTFDVVVFGATSFVGQIITRYLHEHQKSGAEFKWAIAGRSKSKLDDLKKRLKLPAAIKVMVVDADDEAALKKMCTSTKVVLSTVGPYALYGEPLVRACVETGTDYCDLTGEVQWIHRMIKRHHSKASETGARIVNCCGFDSIPSDLGIHFLQAQATKEFGAPCIRTKLRVFDAKGGMSGGTVASLMNVMREIKEDPSLASILTDHYALCDGRNAPPVKQNDVTLPQRDPDFKQWVGPFVMAAINTRIVQRSNFLLGHAYGDDFTYDEAMLMGSGVGGMLKSNALTTFMGSFMAMANWGPSRRFLEKYVVPKPGEGPSEKLQEEGFFDVRLFGETKDGKKLTVKVFGQGDPGYGSTAKMISQAALCLALDVSKADCDGGFWTPASIFGDKLITRLQDHADVTFEKMS